MELQLTRSLGIRLFFLLLLIGILIFLPATMFLIRVNSQHLMEQIVGSAKRMNNLIQGSVHYRMLQNQKAAVAEIIRTLGQQPGVEAIRIYNTTRRGSSPSAPTRPSSGRRWT